MGMRAPQLAAGADSQFEMMTRAGFIWDNTLSANPGINADPFWPQTLDHRVAWNCHEQGCPQRCELLFFVFPDNPFHCFFSSFPGIWEIPLNQFYGAYMKQIDSYRRSSMIRAAVDLNNTIEELVYSKLLQLKSNEASLDFNAGLQLRSGVLLEQSPIRPVAQRRFPPTERQTLGHAGSGKVRRLMRTLLSNNETLRFLSEVMTNKDVYVVTMKQLVDWMKNPTPLSRINEVKWVARRFEGSFKNFSFSPKLYDVQLRSVSITTTLR